MKHYGIIFLLLVGMLVAVGGLISTVDLIAAKRVSDANVQVGQIGRFQMQAWRLGEGPYQFFVIDTTSGEIWWYNKDETRWQRQAPSLRGHID